MTQQWDEALDGEGGSEGGERSVCVSVGGGNSEKEKRPQTEHIVELTQRWSKLGDFSRGALRYWVGGWCRWGLPGWACCGQTLL